MHRRGPWFPLDGFAEALGKLEKLQLSDLFRLDALAY